MRCIATFLASFGCMMLASALVHAQFEDPLSPGTRASSFEDVASISTSIEPAQAKPGQMVTFKLTITPSIGCWTYPANPPSGQFSKNVIKLPTTGELVFVEPVSDPAGAKEKPSELGGVEKYYPTATTWEFKAFVKPTAAPGKRTIALTGTRIQACNKDNCFYTRASAPPSATVEVLAGPAETIPAAYADKVQGATAPTPPAPPAKVELREPPVASSPVEESAGLRPKDAQTSEQHKAALEALRSNLLNETNRLPSNSLWTFLLIAAGWGLISLATPCVFPMIPITVSLFLKQGHKSPREVLQMALVYCLTIILVLGLSAVALLSIFRKLSVDPFMNLFLGALFIFFALSLFGMYDITLPNFLLRGAEKRRGAGGMIGTVFGALAFSIVSFTCVAPFLGGFAGMAASGQFSYPQLIAGGLTFATAFASPFFILALFPSLLKKIPRSGGWMDTVKAVMGFLELAAALKFFRTAELRMLSRPEYFTYDVCIAGWVVISLACGLYLLNLYRLPHDHAEHSSVGVMRLLFAVLFLGLSFYLMPAMFKTSEGQNQRPRGAVYAWVDAFLLPEPAEGGKELPWSSDLVGAIEAARKDSSKRFVFVDFTGVTCTNCKLNEYSVFPLKQVESELRKYQLVQMYTDEVPASFYRSPPSDSDRSIEAELNLDFQRSVFGKEQLPLYVILEPVADGKVRVVDVYDEGKINNITGFVEFLRKPLGK